MTVHERAVVGYFRRAEIARMVGIPMQLLEYHLKTGRLPPGRQIDGSLLFDRTEVETIKMFFASRKPREKRQIA